MASAVGLLWVGYELLDVVQSRTDEVDIAIASL
jgi:hypothetical protein